MSLKATVTEPIQEITNVSTWKIKIITHPEEKTYLLKELIATSAHFEVTRTSSDATQHLRH